MIIYTDAVSSQFGEKGLSPAITYACINDFSTILDEIRKGNLPTNTNQPFDVNYDLKQPESSDVNTPPWMISQDYVNPWSNL